MKGDTRSLDCGSYNIRAMDKNMDATMLLRFRADRHDTPRRPSEADSNLGCC